MSASELSVNLKRFLRESIPTFQAAELLVFLSQHVNKRWGSEELVEAIRPSIISLSSVKEYLHLFKLHSLLDESVQSGFLFSPKSSELQASVEELAHAYNERPVTLIRTIYSQTDAIQSFADAFQIKNNSPL